MSASQEQSLEALFFSEATTRVRTLLDDFNRFKASGEGRASLARTLHTLKGSARMVGFTELAEEIHHLEDIFNELDYSDPDSVRTAEQTLSEVVEKLSTTRGAEDSPGLPGGAPAPFSLAQNLLSSVARLETLLESWGEASDERVGRDRRIRLELSLSSELKELTKHAFGLAFGQPHDLFYGLQELASLVAESEGKKVGISCRAEAYYILREYIPELRSVLVHLVSNCVAHGLELPEQRRRAGKPESGKVSISLTQSGDKLSLSVCDDGAGVDLQTLRRKYEGGGADRPWDELAEEERLNYLFQAGTSLKEGTTLHAGRGVGLSSVRETARRLGGEVRFEPAEVGSRIRFTVPSPFYVADCLAVVSGGHHFSVDISSVELVEAMERRRLPSLCSALRMPVEADQPGRFALWVAGTGKKAGVSVDLCVGLRERLVYPTPPVRGMSAAVVGLADSGKVKQLVVDLTKLQDVPAVALPAPAAPTGARLPAVLVVDDSPTTRSILAEVLTRTGYRVVEANDGAEALERLEEEPFQVVVSDLEMPNLDGLRFLEALREESSPHAALPFVLFTSRDDDKSFQKALLLGADRCLSKADFDEGRFLALLKELVRAD